MIPASIPNKNTAMKKILLSAALILTIGFTNAHIDDADSWQRNTGEKRSSNKMVDASKDLRVLSTMTHFVSPGLMNSLQ